MTLELLLTLFACIAAYTVYLYFRDRREARVHEAKLTVELSAECRALLPLVKSYDERLDVFKNVLVTVLKDMRELVKDTESERKRVAGNAAATLLRPDRNRRMPQP